MKKKKKEILLVPVIETKKPYKKLKRGVRLYYPQKRTVLYKGRYYTVQFPHMLAVSDLDGLCIAFSDEKAKIALPPPLPNVSFYEVCMPEKYSDAKLTKMIKGFWTTEFTEFLDEANIRIAKEFCDKRFHAWEKMSLKQVEKAVQELAKKKKYTLEDFLDNMW